MKKLPVKTQRLLSELEVAARANGVAHHWLAARELARRRVPAREIEFMTRWLFSKEAIKALQAEARLER
jgi:hypothetical protein